MSLANNHLKPNSQNTSCKRARPGKKLLNFSRTQSRPKFRLNLGAYLRRKLDGTNRLSFNFRNDATPSGKRAVYFAAVFYKRIKQRAGKGGGELL